MRNNRTCAFFNERILPFPFPFPNALAKLSHSSFEREQSAMKYRDRTAIWEKAAEVYSFWSMKEGASCFFFFCGKEGIYGILMRHAKPFPEKTEKSGVNEYPLLAMASTYASE